MIAFDLQCSKGHAFEGWFEDGKAYDQQKRKGLLTCPVCNDDSIIKVLSPVAIKSTALKPRQLAVAESQLKALQEQMTEYVEKNFDNVGHKFATEALKIHYGASEPRNIRGVSTKEEEKQLKEEGIEFFKVPLPPANATDS
jgi:hypothetical protein